MTDDFAVLDFALVAVPAQRVAEALETISLDAGAGAQAKPSLIDRFLGRAKKQAQPEMQPLLVQPPRSLDPAPLTRHLNTDMGFGSEEDPIRVSAPLGAGGLTLIELRERAAPGQSDLLKRLSRDIAGTEIFAFRLSGARHPGQDCGFSVYLNGATTRALATTSDTTDDPENWVHEEKGYPLPLETEARIGGGEAAISHDDIHALLRALGIDSGDIFEGADRETVFVMSKAAGGMSVVQALTKAAAVAESAKASGWEDEVTGLLVHAVEDALPEADQVPWLDKLTTQLEAGDIEEALNAALALIDQGSRAENIRAADAARLKELFQVPSQPAG